MTLAMTALSLAVTAALVAGPAAAAAAAAAALRQRLPPPRPGPRDHVPGLHGMGNVGTPDDAERHAPVRPTC